MLGRPQQEALQSVRSGHSRLELHPGVAGAFEALVELIEAVNDESERSAFKRLCSETLKGQGNERSMRLNNPFRRIVEVFGTALVVLGIEDYP